MLTQSTPADPASAVAEPADAAAAPVAESEIAHRPRRLRRNGTLRRMVRETVFTVLFKSSRELLL